MSQRVKAYEMFILGEEKARWIWTFYSSATDLIGKTYSQTQKVRAVAIQIEIVRIMSAVTKPKILQGVCFWILNPIPTGFLNGR